MNSVYQNNVDSKAEVKDERLRFISMVRADYSIRYYLTNKFSLASSYVLWNITLQTTNLKCI